MLPILPRPWKLAGARMIERATGILVVSEHNAWQIHERLFLRKLFTWANVDCVFDVGANIGQYATLLRREVGFKGAIISIEPVPENAALLREQARGDKLWLIEEVALSDTSGERELNVTVDTQASSLNKSRPDITEMVGAHFAVTRQCPVRSELLSSVYWRYANELGFKRPFLKMDTQGHDLAVITGAGSDLQHFIGLQSELSVVPLYENTPDYRTALGILEDAGFTLSAIVPNNAGHFPRLFEFDCIMINKRLAGNGTRGGG
jgi:FkbM family methyltransferase